MNTPDPNSLNPAQPNIHDEAMSGVNFFVKCIFAGFTLAVAGVIVWFILAVTRTPKVVEEYAIQKLDPPVDWLKHTNVYYGNFTYSTNDTIDFSDVSLTLAEVSYFAKLRFFTPDDEEWMWSSAPADNNWHWTNVVFSSTREPVVTKTNGEWRIGFK